MRIIGPAVRRNISFGMQRLIGSAVGAYYQEFLRIEKSPRAAIESVQSQRLDALLRHAVDNCGFYADYVAAKSLQLDDFPILTRALVGQHHDSIMPRGSLRSAPRRFARYGAISVKTGGSTGAPTAVIHGPEYRDRGRAARLYSQYLCGFPFGVPYYRVWGSMEDVRQSRQSCRQIVMRSLSGEVLFNAFRLTDEGAGMILETMRSSGARHLMAYTDAAHALAEYSERSCIGAPQLNSVMACAGTLVPSIRDKISKVFGCRVHNKYGSRECAEIACECEYGGFHIYANNVLVEVVDERGHRLPAGHVGRILVTLLANKEFPLIRYEIGDIGSLSDRDCPCGRPFPLLTQVEGRSLEILRTSTGAFVSPILICHLVGVVHNNGIIKRYQAIQESYHHLTLKVQLARGSDSTSLMPITPGLTNDLKAVFGSDVNITFDVVDEIAPSPSGKYVACINRISSESSVSPQLQ